ncbi:hypothetical protein HL653_12145 [Sphingomonas sp. AP4-R1]|uniref:hypothetical protein n=1 Tax=Sphingomonas sp. AP4-R1 TaxID=2735134 RepID=UPI0014937C95|nr:hypothetical protein [Sphingomonas sp. AP4-R1]QJU58421.1 hypothetical protein HL653_12145 [Sphingomonas sp. AP4-R1]
MEAPIEDQEIASVTERPKLSAWLWQPWYAKLWWVAIPVWWLGMAASARIDFLESFYRGALAGYLNILFFPMTALMVLGVGYVRERLDDFVGQGHGMPLSADEEADEEEVFFRRRALEEHERLAKRWRSGFDPSDPRSGPLWIGSPLNPHNPGYINPHTGKFNAS